MIYRYQLPLFFCWQIHVDTNMILNTQKKRHLGPMGWIEMIEDNSKTEMELVKPARNKYPLVI